MKSANWLIRMVVATILSAIGWRIAMPFGIFAAFVVSTVAGGYGLFLGGRIARRLFY